MGTIAQEITRIQGAKSDIRTSTNAKLQAQGSQEIPANATIDQYAPYIDAIQQGGSQGNPFDNQDLAYLMYKGRFLNNIDNIYNSTRNNLSSWGMDYFAYNAGQSANKISSENYQKILNIIAKNFDCGNNAIKLQYAVANMYIGDDDNDIIFKPSISGDSITSINISHMFNETTVSTGKNLDIIIDFSDICNKIAYSNINDFSTSMDFINSVYDGTLNVHIKKFPVNALSANTTIGPNYSGYYGAITDITVYGPARYNVNIKSCTRMTVEKCIDFLNSFDAKTVSRNVTITIPTSLYNQLTEEQKQIITDKGYILASA